MGLLYASIMTRHIFMLKYLHTTSNCFCPPTRVKNITRKEHVYGFFSNKHPPLYNLALFFLYLGATYKPANKQQKAALTSSTVFIKCK